MNKNKNIPIRCEGSRFLNYERLKTFQGDLKEMTKEAAGKLKASILKFGWVAPVFVWNKNEILDGHGRLLVLGELLKAGYTIGDLPVVDIEARTKREAAEILLAINSKYQTITDDGLYHFMHEMELGIDELSIFELPDIDLAEFEANFFEDRAEEEEEKPVEFKSRYEVAVECHDENEQKEVYDIMTLRGHKCRVLIL